MNSFSIFVDVYFSPFRYIINPEGETLQTTSAILQFRNAQNVCFAVFARGLPDTRAAIWRANLSRKFDLYFHKGGSAGWTVIFVVTIECLNSPLKCRSLSRRLSTHGRSLLFEIALVRSMSLFNNSREQFSSQRMSLKQYYCKLAAEYRSSDCYEIAWKWFSRNCTAEDNENDSVHLLSGTTNEIIRILCVITTKRQYLYERAPSQISSAAIPSQNI